MEQFRLNDDRVSLSANVL